MVDYILGTGSFKFLKFWKVLCPGQKLYNWAGNIYGHWSLFYMIVLGWKKWEWRQKKKKSSCCIIYSGQDKASMIYISVPFCFLDQVVA